MAQSTQSTSRRKARTKFPLTLHKTGQYRKRIRGRDYYFGTDPDAALMEYLRVKDDLEAGRIPSPFAGDGPTLKDLCNHFLTNAQSKVGTGEISSRSFRDYHKSCELMLATLGKNVFVEQITPAELMTHRRKLAKTRNATSLGNEIGRCRVILQYAFGNGLLNRPPRFGDFRRPTKSVLRRNRAQAEPRMFAPEQIHGLLNAADPQLRAMILLGCNAGLGNCDCGRLRRSAIDFETGWVGYPRPKTGIPRRFRLWPETLEAVRFAMKVRPAPKDPEDADLVFLTRTGRPWHQEEAKHNAVSLQFGKLVRGLGFYRRGLTFYALRHTFQSVADAHGDYLATRMVMGHATDQDMSGTYRKRFDDQRLERVTDHVRTWLFGEV